MSSRVGPVLYIAGVSSVLLVFVFAAWQFHDLRREKRKREARTSEENAQGSKSSARM